MKSAPVAQFGLIVFAGALLAGAVAITNPTLFVKPNNVLAPMQVAAPASLPPVIVIDQAVQVSEQNYQVFQYNFQPSARLIGAQLSLEVSHVGGTPMDVLVMDRTNFLRFQAGSYYSYMSGVSPQKVQSRFVSPWFQPAEDGVLYIAVQPTNLNDGDWSTSAARLVLKVRA